MTEERKDLVVSGPALPLAVVDPNTPESPERVVVVAKNPEELNKSQARLIEWAAKRVAKEKAELKDLEENLTLATERKWRTIHLKRLVQAKEKQVIFYEKVEAALPPGAAFGVSSGATSS